MSFGGEIQDVVAATEWTIPQARKVIALVEWRQPDGNARDVIAQIEWRLPDARSQDMVVQIDWNTHPRCKGEIGASSTVHGENVSGSTVMGEVPNG